MGCDFDLGSGIKFNSQSQFGSPISTPWAQPSLWPLRWLKLLWMIRNGIWPTIRDVNSGIECGWNQGEPCNACQELLFHSIQDGHFDFPHTEWRDISGEAKDLISKLLVKDARQRLSAEMVLSHPWVKYGGPS